MEKLTYSVEELAGVLGISTVTAYELTRQIGFPTIRVGRRIIVPISGLNRWLEEKSHADKTAFVGGNKDVGFRGIS